MTGSLIANPASAARVWRTLIEVHQRLTESLRLVKSTRTPRASTAYAQALDPVWAKWFEAASSLRSGHGGFIMPEIPVVTGGKPEALIFLCRETAAHVSDTFRDVCRMLNTSLFPVLADCPPGEFQAYRRHVGWMMGELGFYVADPLYHRFPELAGMPWELSNPREQKHWLAYVRVAAARARKRLGLWSAEEAAARVVDVGLPMDERLRAADAVSRPIARDLIAEMVAMTGSDDDREVLAAFWALRQLRSRSATRPIAKILASGRGFYNQVTAALLLRELQDRRALGAMCRKAINSSTPNRVKVILLDSLSAFYRWRCVRAALEAGLRDEDPMVRYTAMETLCRAADSAELVKLLTPLTNDEMLLTLTGQTIGRHAEDILAAAGSRQE